MKSIHGAELFNYVASLREDLKEIFQKSAAEPPVSEHAAHLRHVASKHFGIDQQALNNASDEQVFSALGYVEKVRTASRKDAQIGMVFALVGTASPLMGLGVGFTLVWGGYGLYKLFSACQQEQVAVSCAKRGARLLQDTPSYNSRGHLRYWV